MKILHINGTIEGGAANYVFNLHEDLLKKKIKSYLYIPKKKNKKNIIYPNYKLNDFYFFFKKLFY
tara:strand:- start:273 stop:467 length:195 start_codon:yes stop_codon:yes gene_type:complete